MPGDNSMYLKDILLTNKIVAHKMALYSLCEGAQNDRIWSAGSDGLIMEWNLDNFNAGKLFAQTGERIFCLDSCPDKKILYAGTMQGDLFFINYQEENISKRFRFHQNSIYRMCKWKSFLIVIGGDGIVSQWNFSDGHLIRHLKISHAKLRSLSIDPVRNYAIIGDGFGMLHILDLTEFSIIHQIQGLHQKTIFSILYLEKEKIIITGGLDAMIRILDTEYHLLQEIKSHWFCVNDICNLTGTPFFATASRDKTIRIWNKTDRSLVKEISSPKFATHLHSVNSLIWKEQEMSLFSGGDDGIINHWKLIMDYDIE